MRSISKSTVAGVIASVLALVPIDPALGQARLTVSGGIAAPVSQLSDVADIGYSIAAGLNFGGARLPVGARVEGSLNGFNFKNSNEDVRIFNATANAIVNLGHQDGSPYLIGGLGFYNSRFGDTDSENAVGVNLGGGLRFPLGRFNTFFEARYHVVLADQEDVANPQFIPIAFGIVF